ncbi:MAG: diguanylate cyclase [Planctomycetaceae bacterium]|nr:diguanylate cyclase [Planctomycetaceae bacterium]
MRKEFEELKATGQLPSPNGVGMRILTLTQQEDVRLEELVDALSADPALTGRVLKVASSAHAGTGGAVNNVRDAAVRLGQRSLTAIALGFSLVSNTKGGACAGFDYTGFWSHSLARALGSQLLARAYGTAVPIEAFTLGLLARVGELALATVHPEEYSGLLGRARTETGLDLRQAECDVFGIDHSEVTEAMLRDWGLPDSFALAAGAAEPQEREDFSPLDERVREVIDVLRDARVLADLVHAQRELPAVLAEEGRSLRQRLSLRQVSFETLYDQLLAEYTTWSQLLELPSIVEETSSDAVSVVRRMERRASELLSAEVEPEDDVPVRILAVDDDPFSLKLITRLLRDAGHEVQAARNGREALAATLKFRPQIVVTDWSMPDIDGLDFCRALRRTRFGRRIYVLLLTGHGDEERVLEAFDAGVDDFVMKPFKPRLLLARLRAGVRLVQLQEQAERDRAIHVRNAATQARMNRQLKEAAETDYLTQLPNRRFAMDAYGREWQRAHELQLDLSVLMIDIDDFKRVNDEHGHETGDAVLRATARVLRQSTRRMDVAARMGGEEFLVVCPGVTPEGALGLAERIRTAVESNWIEDGAYRGRVTISIGLASRGRSDTSPEQLLRDADAAVYRAKQLGRNRTVVATDKDSGARSA